MKEQKDYLEDISEIRDIMKRSSNFISLSGLSGILAGIYALIGSFIAYRIVYIEESILESREVYINEKDVILKLGILSVTVLFVAIGTGIYLTYKKSSNSSLSFSDPGFKNLLESLLIPLLAGVYLFLY